MKKRQCTQFSKKMITAVVLAEIAMCAATITLACCGFDMTIGVDVIKANVPFAVVAFAAYSGNSAVEKWVTRTAAQTTGENNSNG